MELSFFAGFRFNPKTYFESVTKPVVLFYGETDRFIGGVRDLNFYGFSGDS